MKKLAPKDYKKNREKFSIENDSSSILNSKKGQEQLRAAKDLTDFLLRGPKCKYCGRRNKNNRRTCDGCGAPKYKQTT